MSTGFTSPLAAVTTKIGSALTSSANTASAGGSAEFSAVGRWVSAPLAAQTLDGTLRGINWCNESNGNLNGTVAIAVKVIQSDDSDRGVLLAVTASDDTSTTPPEMNTGARTRLFRDAAELSTITLSSVNASAGDRIVIEIGFREVSTNTNHTGTMQFGDTGTDYAFTDNLNTVGGVGWVEFSDTITFLSAAPLKSLLLAKRRR